MNYLSRFIKISIAMLAILIFGTACSKEPQEIHYGSDECTHCKMAIMDSNFATELINEKGKAFKFDSIECLSAYVKVKGLNSAEETLWVNDFNNSTWIDAKKATFVKSEVIKSPMGMGLLAFNSIESARSHLSTYNGTIVSWDELSAFEMKGHSSNSPMMKH